MKLNLPYLPIMLLLSGVQLQGAMPGDAPALPITGQRIVQVATEPQLQRAMASLEAGDTVLLAKGVYNLTRSLFVKDRANVTIRGSQGCDDVVLTGKGMDQADFGEVRFGVWSNSSNTTIAHLTIRDTYDNLVIFNPGASSPHLYCVKLLNAGSQFIKVNPADVRAGLGVDDGLVEFCWLEYTGSPPNDHGAGAGYFNGISAHAAHRWTIRGNLFRNLHNPDSARYLWNPAVLFWRHSTDTITEQNRFVNVDRAVAYGLEGTTPYLDHERGVIRNNFVYLQPGLLSAKRRESSDAPMIAWNSPGTQIDHNTLLLNANEAFAVEFRFANTTNAAARNNLADAPIHLRDQATATLSGNSGAADSNLFVHPATGDLHLLNSAINRIDPVPCLGTVTNDIDGDPRPTSAGGTPGADQIN